jgi:ribulose-bisphosphate carboxylase large chain
VLDANGETGGHTLYFPNVTAPARQLEVRLAHARDIGCRGVLVSPFLLGLDVLRELAESSGLILLAHPTFSGALSMEGHGLAPPLLFGFLLRLLGADGVIYVNAGGRFPVTARECAEIHRRLLAPLGDFERSMPVPGGGVDAESVGEWIGRYGRDLMFLIGSSLYAQADLELAASRLARVLERYVGA